MSFALTTDQVLDQTKEVTRRLGWKFLKSGDIVQPVLKCMGLKPGEKIAKLGCPIVIKAVRIEPLFRMKENRIYGRADVIREGFPDLTVDQFLDMFVEHMKCDLNTCVTRIEFDYTNRVRFALKRNVITVSEKWE